MKKLLVFMFSVFMCGIAQADTINLHWLNEDGTTYQNSTCTVDGDLNIPSTAPTKYGYTFAGWKMTSYIPIEYLESTGTQYIDTGIIPSTINGLKTEMKVQSIHEANTANNFFGAIIIPSSGITQYTLNRRPNGYYQFSIKKNSVPAGGVEAINTNDDVVISTTDKVMTLNGVDYTAPYTGSDDIGVGIPMWLFGWNSSTTPNYAKIKAYYCKIWQNNTLVRDMIPVLDPDGTPCMYDKVTQQFFYNQGTGDFIAGPVLTE